MADVTCPTCGEPWNVAEPDVGACTFCAGVGEVGPFDRGRPCARCNGRGTTYPTMAARIAHTGRCASCPRPPGQSALDAYRSAS